MTINLDGYQERVIEESAELDAKIDRLVAFLKSPKCMEVHSGELYRLYEQLGAMNQYSRILGARIAAFPKDK